MVIGWINYQQLDFKSIVVSIPNLENREVVESGKFTYLLPGTYRVSQAVHRP